MITEALEQSFNVAHDVLANVKKTSSARGSLLGLDEDGEAAGRDAGAPRAHDEQVRGVQEQRPADVADHE
jgi:hypothetical protein